MLNDLIVQTADGIQGVGSVASQLIKNGGDPNAMRPYVGKDNRSYISRMIGTNEDGTPKWGKIRTNADATLRHEEWLHIDQVIIKVARERLRAVQDLRDQGLTFQMPAGLGDITMLSEKSSDTNDAAISMEPDRESSDDRQVYDSDTLPLPVIHKDFHFSVRQILASRKGNTPLDISMVEESTRKVAEGAEKLLIGSTTGPTYGGGTVYGYTNFPSALTATLTTPVGAAATRGATLLAEILAMRQQLAAVFHFGPYMVYNAPNWDQYLDEDLKAASDRSVRERLNAIDGISGIKTLDYLTNYDIIMVQMTSNVVREVIGLDIQALQWESHGGMRLNFKVMGILVPQIRADYNGNSGINYGSV